LTMTGTTGAGADFEGREQSSAPQPSAPAIRKGKKEQQREEAFAAGQNSEWGEDLAPLPGTRPN
jgi:hypothetical protein